MNTDQTLSLTPHQQSELEAASEQVDVKAVDQIVEQASGLDTAALLAIVAVTILYHVLAQNLRLDSGIGLALRGDSLRRVITIILGFLSAMLYIGERGPNKAKQQIRKTPLQIVAGAILAIFTLYVASYVYFGLEILTDTIVPTLVEYAALISVILLWRPWNRLKLYRKLLIDFAPALAMFIGVLVLWEIAVNAFDIKQFLLPAPSVIANTFVGAYPRLVAQGWFTFQNALWGYGIGCGAGLLFGLLSARFGSFSKAALPYAVAANSIPIIAFAPIFNQWFGVTNPLSKMAVVVVLTFFPVMINTVRGLTSTPTAALELMRSYAATELEIFRKVRFPTALPYIFTALKVATTISMIGAIVSEYFGGPITGLGVHIADDSALSKFALVWSEIIVASLLGIAFYFVVSLIERMVMPWHISFREMDR